MISIINNGIRNNWFFIGRINNLVRKFTGFNSVIENINIESSIAILNRNLFAICLLVLCFLHISLWFSVVNWNFMRWELLESVKKNWFRIFIIFITKKHEEGSFKGLLQSFVTGIIYWGAWASLLELTLTRLFVWKRGSLFKLGWLAVTLTFSSLLFLIGIIIFFFLCFLESEGWSLQAWLFVTTYGFFTLVFLFFVGLLKLIFLFQFYEFYLTFGHLEVSRMHLLENYSAEYRYRYLENGGKRCFEIRERWHGKIYNYINVEITGPGHTCRLRSPTIFWVERFNEKISLNFLNRELTLSEIRYLGNNTKLNGYEFFNELKHTLKIYEMNCPMFVEEINHNLVESHNNRKYVGHSNRIRFLSNYFSYGKPSLWKCHRNCTVCASKALK